MAGPVPEAGMPLKAEGVEVERSHTCPRGPIVRLPSWEKVVQARLRRVGPTSWWSARRRAAWPLCSGCTVPSVAPGLGSPQAPRAARTTARHPFETA